MLPLETKQSGGKILHQSDLRGNNMYLSTYNEIYVQKANSYNRRLLPTLAFQSGTSEFQTQFLTILAKLN